MFSMKPVCVKCEMELSLEKTGVLVRELFQKDTMVYRIWSADLWKCPECGVEIIPGHGFADKPLASHYEPEKMKKALRQYNAARAKGEAYTIREFPRR